MRQRILLKTPPQVTMNYPELVCELICVPDKLSKGH